MESGDQLVVAERERGGEGAVRDSERCHRRTIARGGGDQVCNGVDSFLPIYVVGGLVADNICGVVAGTRGGGLRLAHLLVGGGKKYLELGVGLLGWIPSFPLLAVVGEHSSLKYHLVCDVNDCKQWK